MYAKISPISSDLTIDVSQDKFPVDYKVPAVLAGPFVEVCVLLGMPPVLTAAATDLWNWKLKDDLKPITFSNLTTITTMTGTSTEIYFHITPCIMHVFAAPLIIRIFNSPGLIVQENVNELIKLLDEITNMIARCKEVFICYSLCVI